MPICSQWRLEIPKVPSGMGLALGKLLIATDNILPKSCPVLLAGPGQLIDLRRNEFMPGIAVVLFDP